MLPKAYLPLHSRMSGSRWVITPSWLSGSWRSYLYRIFCVFLPPLLNIFCSYKVHTISVIYWAQKYSLGVSNFLEEIISIFHSILFLYFFVLIPEEDFLSLLAILWNSVFKWVYLSFYPLPLASLLFSGICKASSDNHFAFWHFFFLWMVLILVSYRMSWTSVHSSSGTLSISSNPLNLFVTSTV